LWLAPQIFGMLFLALVFIVLVPFFWRMPVFSLIAATLVVVMLGMLWYMHRWRRRHDLTCAPDGLHITGVGGEHVVAWADLTGVDIADNLHLGGSSVLVKLARGRTVRQISRFVFSEAPAAEHARSAILTWQAAYAGASPGTGAARGPSSPS